MKKIKKILGLIFMIALCFSIRANVNAVTLPELKITRFDYGVGDKCINEDATYFTSSISTNISLHAIIAHGNDMALPDLPIGTYVDMDQLDDVTWTSSNTNVATVDENGVVKGVAAGTATITAKYTDSSTEQQYTATKDVTFYGTQACNPSGIHDYTYRIFYSTGTANGPSSVELKKVIVGTTSDETQDYTLPTPTREGYKFEGWYADRNYTAQELVKDIYDVDFEMNYLNNSTPCKSYLEIGTVYAKWIPVVGQGSVPTDIDQSTDTAQTVKVDDTALGSNLYIIAVAILLLTFGTLMVIISLRENKVKIQ